MIHQVFNLQIWIRRKFQYTLPEDAKLRDFKFSIQQDNEDQVSVNMPNPWHSTETQHSIKKKIQWERGFRHKIWLSRFSGTYLFHVDKYLHKKNHQMENGNLAVLHLHWNLTWKQEE